MDWVELGLIWLGLGHLDVFSRLSWTALDSAVHPIPVLREARGASLFDELSSGKVIH